MNLLVVEDDAAAQFALGELLGDLGAQVLVAGSGEDALRMVLKHQVAAILLDVRLPGMDGYEVAAAIRTLERTRRIPIIFMSAEEDRRTQARGGDEDLYLRKPLEPDVIRPTLAQLLKEATRAS